MRDKNKARLQPCRVTGAPVGVRGLSMWVGVTTCVWGVRDSPDTRRGTDEVRIIAEIYITSAWPFQLDAMYALSSVPWRLQSG